MKKSHKLSLFINGRNKKKGFTLVETLVAVSILVLGSLGPLVIAAQGIASAGYAKDQIVGYYLAQEGIEFVRNDRDSNAIQGFTSNNPLSASYWLTGLDACIDNSVGSTGSGCRIDAKKNTITVCETPTCKLLNTDNNGYYGYTGANPTTYTRVVKILPSSTSPNNEGIKTIKVDVSWTSRGKSRSFSLSENIYNSN